MTLAATFVGPIGTARAEPTEEAIATPPVRVRVAGPSAARAQIVPLLDELLAGASAPLNLAESETLSLQSVLWSEEPVAASAFVWVDLTMAEGAAIFVADGARQRVLVRKVAFSALDEAAKEQIGQIVASSVEALVDGATIGIAVVEAAEELGVEEPEPEDAEPEEPEPEASEPEPPPRTETAPRPVAVVGGGYHVQPWASDSTLHGPSMTALVWIDRPFLIGGGLAVRGVLPLGFDVGVIDVSVGGAEVLGALGLGGFVAPNVSLHGEMLAGVTALRVQSRSRAPEAELPRPATFVRPAVGAQVGPSLWWPLRRAQVVFSLRAGAQLDASDVAFEADGGAFSFDPWRVRPSAEFSVSWGTR